MGDRDIKGEMLEKYRLAMYLGHEANINSTKRRPPGSDVEQAIFDLMLIFEDLLREAEDGR